MHIFIDKDENVMFRQDPGIPPHLNEWIETIPSRVKVREYKPDSPPHDTRQLSFTKRLWIRQPTTFTKLNIWIEDDYY